MYKDGQKVWGDILSGLKLSISSSTFRTWFAGSYLMDYKKGENQNLLVVGVKNSFLKEQIEKRYLSKIEQVLLEKNLARDRVLFVVSQKIEQTAERTPLFSGIAPQYFAPLKNADSINPNHTFDNFVVGPSNNLAYLAASQVSSELARVYNPLVIYGPSGVGKTHLLQAVANEVLAKYEDAKILYVTAEKFTNDYLESLRNKTQSAFRSKYRSVHLLIVDDIQFLAGKESTQDEFFHTFNELYLSGKQLVVASDKHPKELGRLNERLVSRLMGGMSADVGFPDYELRVGIIRIKCAERKVKLTSETVEFIASNCQGGARELEGMLTNVLAQIKMTGSFENTQFKAVSNKKTTTKDQIIDVVCGHFKTNIGELKSSSRMASLVCARQILMYFLRLELSLSLDEVGSCFGRDHSTVIHSLNKVRIKISQNQKFADEVSRLRETINI